MTDAVHYFVPNNPAVARTLRQRAIKIQHELKEQLAAGLAENWGDYCTRAGIIRGLQIVIDLCEEVEKEIMEN